MKPNDKVAARIAEEYLDRWRRVARHDELATTNSPRWKRPATRTLTGGSPSAPDAEPVRPAPERQEVAPALALFGATIVSSVAFTSGALRLVFDTGTHLNVEPDPPYEAWNTRGPDELRFVCPPGGGLSIFR